MESEDKGEEYCKDFTAMKEKGKYTIKSRQEYLSNRNLEVTRIRNSARQLSSYKITEYIDDIVKSYEKSTDSHKIAKYQKERTIVSLGYRSIGLYQAIEKDKFFAKDYIWHPFFSDVGRAISRGERKYINNRLGKYVRGVEDTISYSKPDFNILRKHIIGLLDKDVVPNTILAPIQIYSKFVQNFKSELAEADWKTNRIIIEQCDIQIVWSHKYAPLKSFIIFDSSEGIWHSVHDAESENGLTVAIGESKTDKDKIVFFAETIAYYEILDVDAFTRINLSY
jgi:hypothetical protein